MNEQQEAALAVIKRIDEALCQDRVADAVRIWQGASNLLVVKLSGGPQECWSVLTTLAPVLDRLITARKLHNV